MSVKYHEGKFPPSDRLDWGKLARPMIEAQDAIARYDSFLGIIPDSSILVAPMMTQEAVTSSRIEGTHATVGDVLAYEAGSAGADPAKQDDVMEVLNYQRAIRLAEEMLEALPMSGRVLRAAHAMLLQGVRGQYKSPGQYRHEQNWIGGSRTDIGKARYVPVPPDQVETAMARWERFVNESDLPTVLKVSVAHAEFESIHPFLDGNGRIGRMVIPLMLYRDGVMSSPCFYLSEFFEHRNDEYLERLYNVSANDDWTGWCVFFLDAMAKQAKENHAKAERIFSLYEGIRHALLERTGSASADVVVSGLFRAAIFRTTSITKLDGVTPKTARRLLAALADLGVIQELEPRSGSRPAIYVFPELLSIVAGIGDR